MLKINLSPVFAQGPRIISWVDPIITIDSIEYNLSDLPDGATAEHEILLKAARIGNDYEIEIRLPHGLNAPEETRFPVVIEVTENGEITLPIYNEVIVVEPIPEPEPEQEPVPPEGHEE